MSVQVLQSDQSASEKVSKFSMAPDLPTERLNFPVAETDFATLLQTVTSVNSTTNLTFIFSARSAGEPW